MAGPVNGKAPLASRAAVTQPAQRRHLLANLAVDVREPLGQSVLGDEATASAWANSLESKRRGVQPATTGTTRLSPCWSRRSGQLDRTNLHHPGYGGGFYTPHQRVNTVHLLAAKQSGGQVQEQSCGRSELWVPSLTMSRVALKKRQEP